MNLDKVKHWCQTEKIGVAKKVRAITNTKVVLWCNGSSAMLSGTGSLPATVTAVLLFQNFECAGIGWVFQGMREFLPLAPSGNGNMRPLSKHHWSWTVFLFHFKKVEIWIFFHFLFSFFSFFSFPHFFHFSTLFHFISLFSSFFEFLCFHFFTFGQKLYFSLLPPVLSLFRKSEI